MFARALFGVLLFVVLNSSGSYCWSVSYDPSNVTVTMEEMVNITVTIRDLNITNQVIQVKSENPELVEAHSLVTLDWNPTQQVWTGRFNLTGIFLGTSNVYVEISDSGNTDRSTEQLSVIVIREMRVIDHIFTWTTALLVSVLYINFGAALDLNSLKGILKKPIGPAIGFFSQFVLMPMISYVLGLILFSANAAMALGLFFTGCSPAGGASNVWTVILNGNIDLSITMTTISTFAAFAMIPLWIFTLGRTIFDRADMTVPYSNIATYAICLIVPLFIGIAIQKWLPRFGKILVRILKPLSTLLILFIVIFAIVTNLYLFKLFSWQIIVGGIGLPWLGYSLAWVVAILLRQNRKDALTIAIEAGIQNTGISIFLLRFSLPQPQADLTTVMPVSVAIMTPIPLIILYIYQRIQSCKANRQAMRSSEEILKNDGLANADYGTKTN